MGEDVEVPQYEIHDRVQLDPATTALVVIDMQNDFVKEGGSLQVPDAQGTIATIQGLIEQARDSGARVVYSQDTHGEGDPEFDIWPEHAREGTWGWQIVDELTPEDGETVIRKPRYDAFYATDLEERLEEWGIRTLVICGTVANICVHYTAASAAIRWYDVVIPRDATSALEPFDLQSSLRQTAFLFAGVVTDAANIELRGT
ncbi:MAG: cysteine hydrolase [Thermoleophilaceae bacterium]|jgi:nicotinamidase-related amidase|nr:cysteine hydrolase [Thermoleophilaceae bacterium]